MIERMPGIHAAYTIKQYVSFHGVMWPSPLPNTLARNAVSGNAKQKKTGNAGLLLIAEKKSPTVISLDIENTALLEMRTPRFYIL